MTEIDGITLVFKQLYAPGVVVRLLECDWCGYEIEGDELVKTLKGPMHWSCSQEAHRRGCFKQGARETRGHGTRETIEGRFIVSIWGS